MDKAFRILVMVSIGFFVVTACRSEKTESASIIQDSHGYELRVDLPENVGDVYRIEVKIEDRLDESGGDSKGKFSWCGGSKTSIEMAGTSTTLTVNKNHQPSKVKIRLDALNITREDKIILEARQGDELVLERKDKSENNGPNFVATLNGKNLDGIQAFLLSRMVELGTSESEPATKEIFDLSGKKKIGDSWSINSQAFIEHFSDPKMTKDQVKGNTTFIKIVEDHGTPYAMLQNEVDYIGEPTITNPKGQVISDKIKILAIFHVPLNEKTRNGFGTTKYVRETVSRDQMNVDGTDRPLFKKSTITFLRTYRSTLISVLLPCQWVRL